MSDRAELMRALYLEGATLQQIGEKFGVTRERVRQILSEQYGITRTDGGASKRAAARRSIHQNKVSERLMHKWGVSKEEWKKHCDNGLLQAYRYQKNNAVRRGVQFKLTFPEWLSSGHMAVSPPHGCPCSAAGGVCAGGLLRWDSVMTDPSDTWASAWRRLNSKPNQVRVRYLRFVMWVTRNQQPEF